MITRTEVLFSVFGESYELGPFQDRPHQLRHRYEVDSKGAAKVWSISGGATIWSRQPAHFSVPIKYGLFDNRTISLGEVDNYTWATTNPLDQLVACRAKFDPDQFFYTPTGWPDIDPANVSTMNLYRASTILPNKVDDFLKVVGDGWRVLSRRAALRELFGKAGDAIPEIFKKIGRNPTDIEIR